VVKATSLILPLYHDVYLPVKVNDKLYHKLVSSTPVMVENRTRKNLWHESYDIFINEI